VSCRIQAASNSSMGGINGNSNMRRSGWNLPRVQPGPQ
jgi:hypothetical protein